MIRLEAVARGFGTGAGRTAALDGVGFDVAPGEFVAVAGPSGSGKTTLLHVIGALDRPDTGHVLVDGVALETASEQRAAQLRLTRIGFVFQNFNLVPVLDAAENVELPLLFRRDLGAAERRRRVEAALDRVGLADRATHRPQALSGGEQQRVAVARALAGEPALVLADEPTANLDHETGAAVVGLMQELNRERGTTFLLATHDAELLRLADRVLRLRDGRLVGGMR